MLNLVLLKLLVVFHRPSFLITDMPTSVVLFSLQSPTHIQSAHMQNGIQGKGSHILKYETE